MPLLTAEAEKLSQNLLVQGVIENIVTSDQLYSLLPFTPVEGKAVLYNRELTLGSAAFVDTDDAISESAATFTPVTEKLRRIVSDVDVDDFLQGTMSDQQDQTAVQIAKKSKKVGITFADKLINGDNTTNPKEFDGLLKLLPSGQRIGLGDTAAVALAFDHLDQLIDKVKVGMSRVLVMNSRTIRSYFALCRALGGTDPLHIAIPGVTAPGLPSYRGIPILKNDYIPVDMDRTGAVSEALTTAWTASTVTALGTWRKPTVANGHVYLCTTAGTTHTVEPTWGTTPGGTTSEGGGTVVWTCYKASYCPIIHMSLDEEEGVHGLIAAMQAGIEVKLVGPVQNKDATRWRVRWYTGLALKSELALSIAHGINN
jgi:hypothetical protein